MAKKLAVFGGSRGTAAVFLKLCKIYGKIRLYSFLTYVLRLKPSLKITDYMKLTKLPPSLVLITCCACAFSGNNNPCFLEIIKMLCVQEEDDSTPHVENEETSTTSYVVAPSTTNDIASTISYVVKPSSTNDVATTTYVVKPSTTNDVATTTGIDNYR